MWLNFIRENKNLICVTLAFSALLTSAQTAQQYITLIFSEAGEASVGFLSLILLYVFFLVGSLIAPLFITKYGPRTCFLYSTIFYVMSTVAVGVGNAEFLYISITLLGLAAGVLWNGHFVFMGAISAPAQRARNAGFFWSVFAAMTGGGLIVSGMLVEAFAYDVVFFGYAAVGLLAVIPFLLLDDLGRGVIGEASWKKRLPLFSSITTLRMSATILATYMIYGLVISYIPLEIAEISGKPMVGYLSALFFVVPALASYPCGRLADKVGRFPAIFIGFGVAIGGLVLLYFAHGTPILVAGIVTVTAGFAILNPLMTALPADISPKGMVERVSATFNVSSALGIMIGIAMPYLFLDKSAYLILALITLAICLAIGSLAKKGLAGVRIKISGEISPPQHHLN